MRECPECRATIAQYAKKCRCGWNAADEAASGEPIMRPCDYCLTDFQYFRKNEQHGGQNRIVGRSRRAGYICRDCYEGRNEYEFDATDARIERLYEEHKGDHIGIMLRAAHGKQTKAERHELIQWMKDTVRDFGKLPYDKSKREVA